MSKPKPEMMTKAEVTAALQADYKVDCRKADASLLTQIPDADSFERFGRLVLKMALGEIDPKKVPDGVMREVLDDMGIAIPDDWKIQFRRRPKNTFVVTYPTKDMARAALCQLRKPGASYNLPTQYADWVANTNRPEIEQFYEFRVGDYTLNFCRD